MTDNATDLASEEQPTHSGHGPVRRHGRLHRSLHAHPVLSLTTKLIVAIVGTLVTAVGVVMIVTPGPAFVLIPLGLAILSTEFEFARRWLRWARAKAEEAKRKSDALDPAVRRRRLVLTGVVVLARGRRRDRLRRGLRLAALRRRRVELGAEPGRLGARPPRDVSGGPIMR